MSVVNFTIPKPLLQKVNKAIKEQGFASKAEFFRFSALFFIHHMPKPDISNEEFEAGMKELAIVASKKLKNKKLPSLKQQFADL